MSFLLGKSSNGLGWLGLAHTLGIVPVCLTAEGLQWCNEGRVEMRKRKEKLVQLWHEVLAELLLCND